MPKHTSSIRAQKAIEQLLQNNWKIVAQSDNDRDRISNRKQRRVHGPDAKTSQSGRSVHLTNGTDTLYVLSRDMLATGAVKKIEQTAGIKLEP